MPNWGAAEAWLRITDGLNDALVLALIAWGHAANKSGKPESAEFLLSTQSTRRL
jgi:hypothetical protein